jgi:hypothetical protein
MSLRRVVRRKMLFLLASLFGQGIAISTLAILLPNDLNMLSQARRSPVFYSALSAGLELSWVSCSAR